MEIYPSIAIIFFLFILQKYVQFLLFGFAFMNYLKSSFFFFFFSLSQAFIYLLFKNYQILYFLLQQGFHLFYFQVVFELCLYVYYQSYAIILFLIFIFVSNIICVCYKNVIIRQLISYKRIMFIFLANEIPLVKFPQVFNY